MCCKVRPVRFELLPLDQQVVLCHSDVGEERERVREREEEKAVCMADDEECLERESEQIS